MATRNHYLIPSSLNSTVVERDVIVEGEQTENPDDPEEPEDLEDPMDELADEQPMGVHLSGGGYGCTSTSSSTPTPMLLLLMVFAWAVGIRRRFSRIFAVSLASAVVLLCAPVSADEGFDLQQFHPMPDQTGNFFGASSADVAPHLDWQASVLGNYAHNPLVLMDENGDRLDSVVTSQAAFSLLASVGIMDVLELGIDVPMVFQRTDDIVDDGTFDPAQGGLAMGDLRFVPKAQLFSNRDNPEGRGAALAVIADVWVPSGEADSLQGGEFRGGVRLAYDVVSHGGQRMALNLGYLFRPSTEVMNLDIGDMVTWAIAGEHPLTRDVRLVGEVLGKAGVRATEFSRDVLPIELRAGPKFERGGLFLQGGGGLGVVSGYGTPDFRGFAGVGYSPSREVHAAVEPPPTPEPECRAQTVDTDCPDTPETECADGVLRTYRAACTDGACEYQVSESRCASGTICGEEDGAPACVPAPMCEVDEECDEPPTPRCDEATLTTFVGRCDDGDCEYEPVEEPCPEDLECGLKDGVPACTEPERVQVDEETERIELTETIHFATNSDEIESRSLSLVDEIAEILENHPQIRRVRIEGHTDSRGARAHNIALSERRAQSVRQALIERGIESRRMEATGVGPDEPIATNDSSVGRAQNRRVEFHITDADWD